LGLRRVVFLHLDTVLQSIVPDEMRGRAMGIWALIFGGMIPLGRLEAGLMADFLGQRRLDTAWEEEIERRIKNIDAGLANEPSVVGIVAEIDRQLGR
jgi:hypothetical protein